MSQSIALVIPNNVVTHLRKALMFSICLKGILEALIRFTLSALILFTRRHSTSPLFSAEAKVSPAGTRGASPVTVSIQEMASCSEEVSYLSAYVAELDSILILAYIVTEERGAARHNDLFGGREYHGAGVQ